MMIHGELTPDLVMAALILLQSTQPMLQVGIISSWYYYFVQFSDFKSLIRMNVIQRMDDKHWESVFNFIQNNANPCLKTGNPLWLPWSVNFLCDKDGKHHEVILSTCHAIMDGMSRGMFAKQFLEYLQIAKDGGSVIPRDILPRPQEEILFEAQPYLKRTKTWAGKLIHPLWRGIWSNILLPSKDFDPLSIDQSAPLAKRIEKVIYCKIGRDDFQKILDYCKSIQITFQVWLTTVAIICSEKTWNLSDGFKLGIGVPVGLRQYIKDHIDENIMGSLNSAVDITYPIKKSNSFQVIAEYVQFALKNDLKERAAQCLELFPQGSAMARYLSGPMINDTKKCGRNGRISITNVGRFKKANATDFQLVGICGSSSQASYGNNLLISCMSYDGECFLTFSYTQPLFSSSQASQFVENFNKHI